VLRHRISVRPRAVRTASVRPLLLSAALVAGAAFATHTTTASATSAPAGTAAVRDASLMARAAGRPNIVLITTDDQTLADFKYMPRTRRLIARQGVTFDGISPHPLCCPARAEILTGQFAQNNRVRSNFGKFGGYRRLRDGNTIATWLDRAGYRTIFMGKFLNGYGAHTDRAAAPGWDDWNPTVGGVYRYHDFTVRQNRRLRSVKAYQTDFFTDLAVQRIRGAAKRRAPFFLWQSYVAPHTACPPVRETRTCWSPPKAAPRHSRMFLNAQPPSKRSRAYNEEDSTFSDKPFPLRDTALLTRLETRKIVQLHRRRLQSLQAVDDGVARMLRALKRAGELNNTLVIFTSDNGYLLGEHRYTGKVLPYEPALKVPLLMRGPRIPRGVVRNRIGTIVDVAPTIVAAAGARPRRLMDGHSLLPVARRGAPSWETLLIQAGPYRLRDQPYGWLYRGVRTPRYTYARYLFSSEDELYDRRNDPAQLHNLAGDPRYTRILTALRNRTDTLKGCAGQRCFRTFRPLPAPGLAPREPQPTKPSPTSEPAPTEPPPSGGPGPGEPSPAP